jgi:copper(I)-binding protein
MAEDSHSDRQVLPRISKAGTASVNTTDWRNWVHVAWIDSRPESLSNRLLFYAMSSTGGHDFGTPIEISSRSAQPSSPQLMIDGNATVVVTWDEIERSESRIMLRQLVPNRRGQPLMLPRTRLSSGDVRAVSPAISSMPGGVIVAWTSGDSRDSVIALRKVGLDAVCTSETGQPAAVGPQGNITVRDAWIRAPIGGQTSAALYATFENGGRERRAIVSVTTGAAEKAEIHSTRVEGSVAMMVRANEVVLEPGRVTDLKPGASHVMLFGVGTPNPGETVTVLFGLDDGTQLVVQAEVRGVATAPK